AASSGLKSLWIAFFASLLDFSAEFLQRAPSDVKQIVPFRPSMRYAATIKVLKGNDGRRSTLLLRSSSLNAECAVFHISDAVTNSRPLNRRKASKSNGDSEAQDRLQNNPPVSIAVQAC